MQEKERKRKSKRKGKEREKRTFFPGGTRMPSPWKSREGRKKSVSKEEKGRAQGSKVPLLGKDLQGSLILQVDY